jgi:hypothetical protein
MQSESLLTQEASIEASIEDRSGLPNTDTKMTFHLSSEEHDMVEKALKKVAQEMGQSMGRQEVDAKEVLLLLAQRILETDVADGCPGARVEREESLYTILYHLCPQCRSAKLSRPEGLVDIPTELVERVEGEAKKVSISPEEEAPPSGDCIMTSECETSAHEKPVPKQERDRPNTYTMVRKLLLRDGSTCSNPCCRRRLSLHAHHIVFRSFGGRTALYNETMVCPLCHALLHRGLLKLQGDPLKGLTWTPKVAELNLDEDLNDGMEKLASLPKVVVAESGSATPPTVAQATECTVVHSVEIDEGLVRASV